MRLRRPGRGLHVLGSSAPFRCDACRPPFIIGSERYPRLLDQWLRFSTVCFPSWRPLHARSLPPLSPTTPPPPAPLPPRTHPNPSPPWRLARAPRLSKRSNLTPSPDVMEPPTRWLRRSGAWKKRDCMCTLFVCSLAGRGARSSSLCNRRLRF